MGVIWKGEELNSFLASRPILSSIIKDGVTNDQLSDEQINKIVEEEMYTKEIWIIDGVEQEVEYQGHTGILRRMGISRDILRRISLQINLRYMQKIFERSIKAMEAEAKEYANLEPVFEFEVVEKIINDWNPMGILAYSDPDCTKCINPDEYYAEIQDIIKRASKVDNLDETILANIIHDVFVKWFFEREAFNFDECLPIAQKILEVSK